MLLEQHQRLLTPQQLRNLIIAGLAVPARSSPLVKDNLAATPTRDQDSPPRGDKRASGGNVARADDERDLIENQTVGVTLLCQAGERVALALDLKARQHSVDDRNIYTSRALADAELVHDHGRCELRCMQLTKSAEQRASDVEISELLTHLKTITFARDAWPREGRPMPGGYRWATLPGQLLRANPPRWFSAKRPAQSVVFGRRSPLN